MQVVPRCLMCDRAACRFQVVLAEDALTVRASARPLFARASLEGVSLPPLVVLGEAGAALPQAVEARLTEQEEHSGLFEEARRRKVGLVRQMDMFLQAYSSGFVGLLEDAHLRRLQMRPVHICALFLEMVRIDGAGATSRMAFPRGGFQALLRAEMRRNEARAFITALGMPSGKAALTWTKAKAWLAARADGDACLLAGQVVLTQVFARLVEAAHHPETGVFRGAMPSVERRAEGRAHLLVGIWLVRRLGADFGCVQGRRRWQLDGADEGDSDVVGWKHEGSRARPHTSQTIVYHAETIKHYRAALAWWLKCKDFRTIQMPGTATRPAYVAVALLQERNQVCDVVCIVTLACFRTFLHVLCTDLRVLHGDSECDQAAHVSRPRGHGRRDGLVVGPFGLSLH